jgi:predicted metal-dependent hydrolase
MVPVNYNAEELESFVASKRNWILKTSQYYSKLKERCGVLEPHTTYFDVEYNKVSIKSQKSRWASCSKKGNLHFNLLLAAAPPDVIDYVIIHELVHLIEFDHSRQFWQLVKEADPDYKKHREWLGNYSSVIKVV